MKTKVILVLNGSCILVGASNSKYVGKQIIKSFNTCLKDVLGPNLDKGSNAFFLECDI